DARVEPVEIDGQRLGRILLGGVVLLGVAVLLAVTGRVAGLGRGFLLVRLVGLVLVGLVFVGFVLVVVLGVAFGVVAGGERRRHVLAQRHGHDLRRVR